jgi:hypothetical protein
MRGGGREGNIPTGFSSMMPCTFCFAAAETMVVVEELKKRRNRDAIF